MPTSTLRALGPLVMAAVLCAAAAQAAAQTFPARPIRLVVGGAVGGGWDLSSRLVAEKMREDLGQPVVVDNKPGADGIIAAELAMRAAPDGYTLLPGVSGQMIMNAALRPNLPYDPLTSFEPVAMIALTPLVLVVNPAVPAATVRELVAHARANPGQLNYGSGSNGFLFATERFLQGTGVDIRRIPYKGGAQTVAAVLAGDVQMAIVDVAPVVAHVKAGKLRALAVTTAQPLPFLPDVPTLADAAGLPGYEVVLWFAMFAPAGTPKDVVARLHASIARSLEAPDLRERLLAAGYVPAAGTPQSLADTMRRELAQVSAMAKAGKLAAD